MEHCRTARGSGNEVRFCMGGSLLPGNSYVVVLGSISKPLVKKKSHNKQGFTQESPGKTLHKTRGFFIRFQHYLFWVYFFTGAVQRGLKVTLGTVAGIEAAMVLILMVLSLI